MKNVLSVSLSLAVVCSAQAQVVYLSPHERSVSGEVFAQGGGQQSFIQQAPGSPAFLPWNWADSVTAGNGDAFATSSAQHGSNFQSYRFLLVGDAGVQAGRGIEPYAKAESTAIFLFNTTGFPHSTAPAVRMWVGGAIGGQRSGTMQDDLEFEFNIVHLSPSGEIPRARFVYPFLPPIGEPIFEGYRVVFGPQQHPLGPAKLRLPAGQYRVEVTPKATLGVESTYAAAYYIIEAWFETITCDADFNGDGTVDFFDMLDFLAAINQPEPTPFFQGWHTGSDADMDGNGIIEFFDYLDFVEKYAAGC